MDFAVLSVCFLWSDSCLSSFKHSISILSRNRLPDGLASFPEFPSSHQVIERSDHLEEMAQRLNSASMHAKCEGAWSQILPYKLFPFVMLSSSPVSWLRFMPRDWGTVPSCLEVSQILDTDGVCDHSAHSWIATGGIYWVTLWPEDYISPWSGEWFGSTSCLQFG